MLLSNLKTSFVILIMIASSFGVHGIDDETMMSSVSGHDLPEPKTLNQAVDNVKKMKSGRSSTQEIAAYVSTIIDDRLLALNQGTELTATEIFYGKDYIEDLDRRWNAERESSGGRVPQLNADPALGRPVFGNDDGLDYVHRAEWAWSLEAGNCEESASIAYYIFKKAGIPARFITNGGHSYVIIGFKDDYDPEKDAADPGDWGAQAYVVDGWTGSAWSSSTAAWHYLYHRGKDNIDFTADRDNPDRYQSYQDMARKGHVQIIVNNAKTGAAIDGLTVLIESGNNRMSGQTSNGGSVTFKMVPEGNYKITARPEKSLGLKPGFSFVKIEERRRPVVNIKLEPIQISIQSPINKFRTAKKEIDVMGSSDDDSVDSVVVVVNGAQIHCPATDGRFQVSVKLEKGRNTIYASAGEAMSNVVNVEKIEQLIVVRGSWTSNKGRSGQILLNLDPVQSAISGEFTGNHVVTAAGRTFQVSINGTAAGTYTGDTEQGRFSGTLELRYSTGAVSPGTLSGDLANGRISGKFIIPKSMDETGGSGTFQGTTQIQEH